MNYTKEEIQRSCHEHAFHLYGTSYIYTLRAIRLGRYSYTITLLGFLVPITIGAVIMAYGLSSKVSDLSFAILSPFAIIQLILSTIALVYRWDDKRAYYLESSISNRQLHEEFTQLAKFPKSELASLVCDYRLIVTKAQLREDQDDKYPFTAKELRKGMRYSLRQHQKACSGCNKVPTDMESSDCAICGKF